MKVREGLAVVIVIVMVALAFVAGESTSRTVTTTVTVPSATSESSLTSTSLANSFTTYYTSTLYTFTTHFYYRISVNYSGSWNLAYWGQNGTLTQKNAVYCNECYGGVMQYNVYGNLSGSGNYQTEIITYGVGYVENVLCVDAAILNANTGALTLTVLDKTGIATAATNPTVEVCATYAV